jgi:hypothetical protein
MAWLAPPRLGGSEFSDILAGDDGFNEMKGFGRSTLHIGECWMPAGARSARRLLLV